jgi:hydroxypyruvate reductase/glycerate 2-kinase
MFYKNHNNIATTNLRKKALDIIQAGIESVNPHILVKRSLRYNETFNSVLINNNSFDLLRGRIFVIGAGKASGMMAEMLEKIIGSENITAGFVNTIPKKYETKKIKINVAGHPLPDKEGMKGAEEMFQLKEKYNINEKDLVICLISGGGSAMLFNPAEGISLEESREINDLLIHSGADINEINIIRKHIGTMGGGRLGKFFVPARLVSIIISDVKGNDFATIASGPTAPDLSTFQDALKILEKYKLNTKIPESILNFLILGAKGKKEESPKSLENCYNYIIGDNATALEAMAIRANKIGLKPLIIDADLKGETEEKAREYAFDFMEAKEKEHDTYILGGETSLKVPLSSGQGGRNQHYTALSMIFLENFNDHKWAMVSASSDGIDSKDFAGAIIDNESLKKARAKNIDIEKFILNYDTGTMFKELDNSLIDIGHTGTNVGDIVLYILE